MLRVRLGKCQAHALKRVQFFFNLFLSERIRTLDFAWLLECKDGVIDMRCKQTELGVSFL